MNDGSGDPSRWEKGRFGKEPDADVCRWPSCHSRENVVPVLTPDGDPVAACEIHKKYVRRTSS